MLYVRNISRWERWMRVGGGAAMVACGLIGLAGSPAGWLLAGAGVVAALSGVAGYCPMCAVAGRKLPDSP